MSLNKKLLCQRPVRISLPHTKTQVSGAVGTSLASWSFPPLHESLPRPLEHRWDAWTHNICSGCVVGIFPGEIKFKEISHLKWNHGWCRNLQLKVVIWFYFFQVDLKTKPWMGSPTSARIPQSRASLLGAVLSTIVRFHMFHKHIVFWLQVRFSNGRGRAFP